ncbi:MAG: hypothetical protein NUV31_11355, partial [Dehalococcoidales bacterium]|nr:hypothetical protein [Dehalococcoidales bacterium]
DLKSYKCVISFGAITSVGEQYSPQPPLIVLNQEFDSQQDSLVCVLNLAGIPNLMSKDKASVKYVPDEADTSTVKSLITAIAGATITSYAHCTPYSVVYDSEDSLINTFQPKDAFRIYVGDDRLSKIKELLEYTNCQMRIQDDGAIHIFVPVTTGVNYDYTYSLNEDSHAFFAKAYRNNLVIPNKVTIQSQPDDEPQYFGSATSTTSYALLPKEEFRQARLQSNEQAQTIAQAIIKRYELGAAMGSAAVPINTGAEVWDYICVTDQRQGDSREGNIGRLDIEYAVSLSHGKSRAKWLMTFSFGDWTTLPKILDELGTTATELQKYFTRLTVKDLYAENIVASNIDFAWIDPEGNIDLDKIGDNLDHLPDGEVYARVKALHLDAGQIKLDESVLYSPGYDPTTKEKGIIKSGTAPGSPALNDLWVDTSVTPNIWKRWNGSAWVNATPA